MRPRSILSLGIVLAAFAVLIGLGTWQMQRLHWKEDVMARVAARVQQPPAALPQDWSAVDLAEWEYRPVEVEGRFRHDLETRVYTLLSDARGPLSGPGDWIMTPLETAAGMVLVNRGFVPFENRRPVARPEGVVTVRGLLRGPEDRNVFTPDDEPGKRLFYARDAAPIAEALGVSLAPFTIDAAETPPGDGLPQAGETRLIFSNRHLEYALTWYGLAVVLIGVAGAFALSGRRRR